MSHPPDLAPRSWRRLLRFLLASVPMPMPPELDLSALRRAPLFSQLSTDVFAEVVSHLELREFEAGQKLVVRDETGDEAFILLQGTAEVIVRAHDGQELPVERLGPSELFGERALTGPGNRRTATVRATSAGRLAAMSAANFERLSAGQNAQRVLSVRRAAYGIDSTGLKIMGYGEWHAHKHKTSNKRRAWRKLHLGVDGDGFIVASQLTDSSVDDGSVGVAMIERIEARIGRFTADGAYDTRAIYEALAAAGGFNPTIVIPPRKTASPSKPPEEPLQQRDAAIERITGVGRRQWRKKAGAHQQARAENGMYRYKRIIGDRLRAKTFDAQRREAMIAVNVINRMTALGMPEWVAIVA